MQDIYSITLSIVYRLESTRGATQSSNYRFPESASHRENRIHALSPDATGNHIKSMKDNTADGSESVQEVLSSREGEDVGQAGDSQNRVHTGPSSNNSQATNPEVLDGLTTPPTSTSDGFSSQGTGHESQLSQLSQLSHLAAVQEPLNVVTRPTLSIVPSAGYKRTADGELKLETFKSPTSPYVRGHSRNVSAISNASTSSRIGEVCIDNCGLQTSSNKL